MRSYNSFSGHQVRHLEAIQAAMVRYETMAIHTKRWSFVLTAGLLALAVQQGQCLLGVVSVVVTFGLWVSDHDFLRSQRLFGKLYEHVRTSEDREPFFMDATGDEFTGHLAETGLHHDVLRWNVFRSRPLWIVYGSQMLAGFIVWLVLRITVG